MNDGVLQRNNGIKCSMWSYRGEAQWLESCSGLHSFQFLHRLWIDFDFVTCKVTNNEESFRVLCPTDSGVELTGVETAFTWYHKLALGFALVLVYRYRQSQTQGELDSLGCDFSMSPEYLTCQLSGSNVETIILKTYSAVAYELRNKDAISKRGLNATT